MDFPQFDDRLLEKHEYWGEYSSTDEEKCKEDTSVPEKMRHALILWAVKPESPKENLPLTEDGAEDFFQQPLEKNEVVRHTACLKKHARMLKDLISSGHCGDVKPFPPFPDKKKVDEKDANSYKLGMDNKLRHLTPEWVTNCLQKTAMVILAQAGFKSVNKSALDVLTDVFDEILSKTCKVAQAQSQKDILENRILYNDVLEKTLQLMGFSGIRALTDYYRKDVLVKQKVAINKCTNLMSLYQSSVNSSSEIGVMEVNVPEIHLPENAESSLSSSLKPGLQMLEMLDEQGEKETKVPS